jgi:hypothetical protein
MTAARTFTAAALASAGMPLSHKNSEVRALSATHFAARVNTSASANNSQIKNDKAINEEIV